MKNVCAFDLDGTLVYTIGDIAASLNYGLECCGFPTLTETQVAAIVGYSTAYMFQHAVPQDAAEGDWKRVGARYDEHYRVHLCDRSYPYAGVLEELLQLKAAGMRLIVVSNKPHRDSCAVITRLFPRDLFSLILGRTTKFATKPAPDSLLFALGCLGARPEEALYVGDSEVDVRFAENTGMECLSVSWGYRTRGELIAAGAREIIDTPDMLAARVLELRRESL